MKPTTPTRGGSWLPWLACALALGGLFLSLEPFWETNDDAAMAMIVHGYGIAAAPDPATVYQSVLYGRLVQLLPAIVGLPAYGVATYGLLALAFATCGLALWRAGTPPVLAAAALFTVFAPTFIYPQFTLVAGLLGVAGGTLLLAARSRLSVAECVLAGTVLALGSLVRVEELVLVGVILCPFFFSAGHPARLRCAITLSCVAIVTTVSAAISYHYYEGQAWSDFFALSARRAPFTDFGYSRYFNKYPLDAVLAGFTFNDVRLTEAFFFADPRVFSVERFDRATAHINLFLWMWSNLSSADPMLWLFTSPQVLALMVLLLVLGRSDLSRAARWSLLLLLAAVVASFLAGKPGTGRHWVPPLAGIVFLRLCHFSVKRAYAVRAVSACVVAGVIATVVMSRNADHRNEAARTRAAFCSLPSDRFYVFWGDTPPLHRIYGPLSPPATPCSLRLYGIGIYAFAPFALERLHAATGSRDLVAALLEGSELDLLTPDGLIRGLEIFVRQHYGKNLTSRILGAYDQFSWYRIGVARP